MSCSRDNKTGAIRIRKTKERIRIDETSRINKTVKKASGTPDVRGDGGETISFAVTFYTLVRHFGLLPPIFSCAAFVIMI